VALRWFVDESALRLGKLLARIRDDVIYPVIPTCQRFPLGTIDIEWTPIVAERGWVAIRRDRRIHARPLEVRILERSRPPHNLARRKKDMSSHQQARPRWWWIQMRTDAVLQRHRPGFVQKISPIQFFWGSVDLNHARFSGRPAPPAAGMPRFFQIAEDQENVACDFWPGNANMAGVALGEPAFYGYTYPEPEGFREATVRPTGARCDTRFGEFRLPYEAVRTSESPEDAILEFVTSVCDVAATLASWDRGLLERTPPRRPLVMPGPGPG